MLSPRQELILRLVVDAYLASARPVGSREVAEKPEIEWGPSTVRADGRRLPPLRRLAACLRVARRRAGGARALAPAPGGRRGDAGDDRRPRPGHRPRRAG